MLRKPSSPALSALYGDRTFWAPSCSMKSLQPTLCPTPSSQFICTAKTGLEFRQCFGLLSQCCHSDRNPQSRKMYYQQNLLAIPSPWGSEPLGFSSPSTSRPFHDCWHARIQPGIRNIPFSSTSHGCIHGKWEIYTQVMQLGYQDYQFQQGWISQMSGKPVALHCPRVVDHLLDFFPL